MKTPSMNDIKKTIEYWLRSSDEDIVVARELIENGHFRHGLFWAHLSLEKVLKAHVSKYSGKHPPKIHNLMLLAEFGSLTLDSTTNEFLAGFDLYQLSSRYSHDDDFALGEDESLIELKNAEDTQRWLKNQL
jgi:HEPN domain-containing protein